MLHSDRMTLTFVLDPSTGLRDGDIVTAVDHIPLRSYAPGKAMHVGDLLTYSVLRHGQLIQVAVRLEDFPVLLFLARAWPTLLWLFIMSGIAVFVFWRRSGDRAAQALMMIASLSFCGTFAWLLGDQVFRLAAHGPTFLDVAGELSLAMIWGAVAHFTLVAPATKLKVTWQRVTALYCLPLLLYGIYLALAMPSAHDALEARDRAAQVSLLPGSVLPLATALLLLLSYRATDDAESRQRMRWLLLTLLFAGTVWAVPDVLGAPVIPANFAPLVFLPPVLALGAAILRYRMFDIEVIIRRSLLYGGLTVAVVGIFLAGAWLLSRIFTRPGLAALLACGLVGFTAPPLHSWLRRRVGRLVYGDRDDPFEVLARLGRIEVGTDPQRVLEAVAETLAHTLRLPFVEIALLGAQSRLPVKASYGQQSDRTYTVPLELANGVVGRLVLAVGPGMESFGPADRRLVETMTRQVSGAASMAVLTAELQRSREQIVLAREEERRWLHNRLHDGLGPSLTAGGMRIQAAKNELVQRDMDAAIGLLDDQIVLTRSLISDIRGLIRNLRPPALSQFGLVGAVRKRTSELSPQGGMRILVEQDGELGELPAAVEIAAFWISVEAVSNAISHARAQTCRVNMTRRDEVLSIEIRDDGRGLPSDVQPSGGLISMVERAEELGGTCDVRPGETRGTVVQARLPIKEADGRLMSSKPIQVIVADDHPTFRAGVRALLKPAEDIEVIAEVASAEEAIQAAADLQPDVIIMDLRMPQAGGVAATREIIRHSPGIAVLVLTMVEDGDSIFAALRAGARGYLLKSAEDKELQRAVEAVASGGFITSPVVAAQMTEFFAGTGTRHQADAFPTLTEREREVLDLIAQGRNNRDIARKLVLSDKTIRNHISNIFAKLHAADRADAIVRAREAGLGQRGSVPESEPHS
jgi:DNA-binding NarL/FixJ family response regulator/signal transduction histidine kinase